MAENQSTDFLLGQITAQLRELVHGQNNMSQAMNGLESSLGKRIEDVTKRVSILETISVRRDAQASVWTAFVKSPFVAWFTAIVASISAGVMWLIGKLH